MNFSKAYSDDEYYTTEKAAKKFFDLVVMPSGVLGHKTLLMPFSKSGCPLHVEATKHHDNVVSFEDDKDLWKKAINYDDCAVVDNPPFSLSAKIEKFYFQHDIPFVLFRSAVRYPKFIYEEEDAGIVFENSKEGVEFDWGLASHINGDEYIAENYPNLIDHLKVAGALRKKFPSLFHFIKQTMISRLKQRRLVNFVTRCRATNLFI